MKKILGFSLFILILLFLPSCQGTKYLMSGAVIEANASFNHYKFAAFKGEYTFKKIFEEDTQIRIVIYTELEDSMIIKIEKDGEVVKELEVSHDNNGTYYVDLEKGNYKFYLVSDIVYSAELLFNWKYEK